MVHSGIPWPSLQRDFGPEDYKKYVSFSLWHYYLLSVKLWYYYRNAKQRIVSLFILESCEIIVLEEYHWIVYLLWVFGIILNDEKGYFGIQKWIFAKFTISKSVFNHYVICTGNILARDEWQESIHIFFVILIVFVEIQILFSKRRQRIWTRFLYRFQTVDPRLKSNSLTSIF